MDGKCSECSAPIPLRPYGTRGRDRVTCSQACAYTRDYRIKAARRRSLPVELAICRPAPAPRPVVLCAVCESQVPNGRWTYCSTECKASAKKLRDAAKPKRPTKPRTSDRPTRQERGYGAEHVRLRREMLPKSWGTPCVRCGEELIEGQSIHLDHNDDRTGYLGFAHAGCNIRAANVGRIDPFTGMRNRIADLERENADLRAAIEQLKRCFVESEAS